MGNGSTFQTLDHGEIRSRLASCGGPRTGRGRAPHAMVPRNARVQLACARVVCDGRHRVGKHDERRGASVGVIYARNGRESIPGRELLEMEMRPRSRREMSCESNKCVPLVASNLEIYCQRAETFEPEQHSRKRCLSYASAVCY